MADWKSVFFAGAIYFILALVIAFIFRNRAPEYNDSQRQAELWDFYKDYFIDANKGAISLAALALKMVITINGAAAIALLAFISHQWAQPGVKSSIIPPMIDSLEFLVLGVFLGALSTGLGYLRMYMDGFIYSVRSKFIDPEPRAFQFILVGQSCQIVAIGLVVVAYIMFAIGMSSAADALRAV